MSSAGSQTGDGGNAPALSLLRVLGRRWFHIVIGVVVAGAVGLAISMATTPTYKATARVFLPTGTTSGSDADLARVVQTQAELATSTQALNQVAAKLGQDERYVAGHVTSVPADSAYYFTITGLADTQKKATELVSTTRDVYKTLLTTYSGGDEKTIAALKAKRAEFAAQVTSRTITDADANTLRTAIQELDKRISDATVAQAISGATAGFTEDPNEVGRIAPKPFTSVLIAGLIGLFLAVAIIWIRYLRRPTVLDGRAAADAIGAPLIVGGTGGDAPSIDTIVSAMAAVLSPTVKVVALTPAASGDLTSETVAGVSASWSDDQGVVLVLDASPSSDVRAVLERLPRATSGELPRWAHEPTCLARSSGTGRGNVLYNRVSPSRASRPGGLAPILADRAPVVDLVLLLTPPLTDLPMTAASALQADAVVVITSPVTRSDELASVPRDWPALAERIVGVIHADRGGFRPSTIASETRGGARPMVGGMDRDLDGGDPEATDRYARPGGNKY